MGQSKICPIIFREFREMGGDEKMNYWIIYMTSLFIAYCWFCQKVDRLYYERKMDLIKTINKK